MTPKKRRLIESKEDAFPENKHVLTPNSSSGVLFQIDVSGTSHGRGKLNFPLSPFIRKKNNNEPEIFSSSFKNSNIPFTIKGSSSRNSYIGTHHRIDSVNCRNNKPRQNYFNFKTHNLFTKQKGETGKSSRQRQTKTNLFSPVYLADALVLEVNTFLCALLFFLSKKGQFSYLCWAQDVVRHL